MPHHSTLFGKSTVAIFLAAAVLGLQPVQGARAAAAAKKIPPRESRALSSAAKSAKTASKSTISTTWRSPRNSKRPLRKSTRFIVLHTTEGAAKGALEKLSANGECHYVVGTDGKIFSIIDRGRIAYHAGLSMWNGQTGLDSMSVGIEVVGYHDKPITAAQIAALKKLVSDLKIVYKIADDRVLTHSMVAYGNPNHWHKKKHRGRKRCGMQFADPVLRSKIGLESKPLFDPDIRSGRLYDADPELTKILYKRGATQALKASSKLAGVSGKATEEKPAQGQPQTSQNQASQSKKDTIGPGRSAWDIARDRYDSATTTYRFPNGTVKKGSEISGKQWRTIPAGTIVLLGDESDTPTDNDNQGLLEIGVDGTAQDLAGDEMASSSTFYFPPGENYCSGASLTIAKIETLPKGTKLLVGYKSGGPVSAKKPVFAICGAAWNSSETYYWDASRRKLVSGGEIDEKNIPKGAMVFWR